MKPEAKEWYSRIKNELLSYQKVKCRAAGRRFETFNVGRRTVARFLVRGKTLCLLLATDPAKYEGTKYTVETVNSTTPCQMRIRSALRAKYACALVADLMNELGVEKLLGYVAQDYYMPYEGVVSLMEKGHVKRNIRSFDRTYKIDGTTGDATEVSPDEVLAAQEIPAEGTVAEQSANEAPEAKE